MSKERAMKNWRKRLDEFDGSDEGVAINYRQYAMLLRQEDLADMLLMLFYRTYYPKFLKP